MAAFYKDMKNTLLSVSNLYGPVSEILLAGTDIAVPDVDTSAGNVTIVLTSSQWANALLSPLVIQNTQGGNDINLLALDTTDPNLQAAAFQEVLGLNNVGSSVFIRLVRTGAGTASISVDGVQIVSSLDTAGTVLIQAVNISPGLEENSIESVTNYVTTDTEQTVTAAKTFTEPLTIAQILQQTGEFNLNTSGIITVPNATDTLVGKSTSDILSNKLLLSSTVYFSDASATRNLTFNTDGNSGGVTGTFATQFTSPKTILFPDIDDTVVTLSASQTLVNKIFTSPTLYDPYIVNSMAVISLPTITDTLVGRTTADTLFNKVLISPGITPAIINGLATLTLPTTTDTLVGRAVVETLTNKTLTLPIITSIVNTGTLSLPTSTDTLVGRNTTDTLTNKLLNTSSVAFVDNSDPTKRLIYDVSLNNSGVTGTLKTSFTTARTITFPDVTDTVVTLSAVQTLTNKRLDSPIISTIVNTGTLTLPVSTDTLVGLSTTDTLLNKTLNSPTISSILNTGTLILPTTSGTLALLSDVPSITNLVTLNTAQTISGIKTFTTSPVISTITNTGALTLPTSTDTLVGRATTDTLTNKTLTSPVISTITNTGALTLPISTDTLVGRATTDTLTNKTLTSPVISTLVNTGTLTVPTTTGTLALLSDVPSITNLVTLNTAQTISGIKTFTASPIISTITNSGSLTLPTSTDTLVGRATTDTLTNKTLTAPIVSTLVNTGTLALPTLTDTLVGRITTDTLSNKTLSSPVISTIVNTGALTLPTSTDTLVGRATTDTLTNKTLTSPVVSTLVNTGTLTVPTTTGTLALLSDVPSITNLVTLNTSQTISGVKTFTASPVISTITNTGSLTLPTSEGTLALISDIPDTSSFLTLTTQQTTQNKTFRLSSNTNISSFTATTFTTTNNHGLLAGDVIKFPSIGSITGGLAANTNYTIFNALTVTTFTLTGITSNGGSVGSAYYVLVSRASNNQSISGGLVNFIDSDNTTNPMYIDTSAATTPVVLRFPLTSASRYIFPSSGGTIAGLSATQTFTGVATFTASPIISTITNTGSLTLPTSTDTLIGRATTDTLTNKTLALPVISTIVNTGTLTLPTSTDTLVGRATTETLTNKTLGSTTVAGSLSITNRLAVAGSSVSLALLGNTIGVLSDVGGFGQSVTDTSAGGKSFFTGSSFGNHTLSSTSAVTTSQAINVYLRGAPVRGTNETFGNVSALYIDSVDNTNASVTLGSSIYIEGEPLVTSGTTYSIYVNSGKSYFGGLSTATSLKVGSNGSTINTLQKGSTPIAAASWGSMAQYATYNQAVTFPSAFSTTPIVHITINVPSTGSPDKWWTVFVTPQLVTTTGFTATFIKVTTETLTGTINLVWTAHN